jgi:hypothetical protein
MAVPTEILQSIVTALEDSDAMPDGVSYLQQRRDGDGLDADVPLPVVQLNIPVATSITEFNSDTVGFVTDDEGNNIGRVYHSEYELTVQADIITVDELSNEDHHIESLIESLRTALYEYDSAGPAEELHEDIWRFQLGTGERGDELNNTPTVRRWVQDIECWSYEEFRTTEDTITGVVLPEDDEIVQ